MADVSVGTLAIASLLMAIARLFNGYTLFVEWQSKLLISNCRFNSQFISLNSCVSIAIQTVGTLMFPQPQ